MAVLQGEIGCSSIEGWDMKTKLSYILCIREWNNILLREFEKIIEDEKTTKWLKTIENYMIYRKLETTEHFKMKFDK